MKKTNIRPEEGQYIKKVLNSIIRDVLDHQWESKTLVDVVVGKLKESVNRQRRESTNKQIKG